MSDLANAQVWMWECQAGDLDRISEILAREGCRVLRAVSLEQLKAVSWSHRADLLILQVCRKTSDSLRLLDELQARAGSPPGLVVCTGSSVYLEAMRHGAFDSISLPVNEPELLRIVSRALSACGARSAPVGG